MMLKDEELENKWNAVLKKLEPTFGEGLDMQAVLFLIGVQELGKGYSKFKKDEKLNVMHVAICTLSNIYFSRSITYFINLYNIRINN